MYISHTQFELTYNCCHFVYFITHMVDIVPRI